MVSQGWIDTTYFPTKSPCLKPKQIKTYLPQWGSNSRPSDCGWLRNLTVGRCNQLSHGALKDRGLDVSQTRRLIKMRNVLETVTFWKKTPLKGIYIQYHESPLCTRREVEWHRVYRVETQSLGALLCLYHWQADKGVDHYIDGYGSGTEVKSRNRHWGFQVCISFVSLRLRFGSSSSTLTKCAHAHSTHSFLEGDQGDLSSSLTIPANSPITS